MIRNISFSVLFLIANFSYANQPISPGYEFLPASADGIGKRYLNREIAAVMGWQGASWLEREEREREERTDLLINALALKPGMYVADIGAGTGYLSRRMAPQVMPNGKIIALDLQPEMLKLLQATVKRSGLQQIEVLLGSSTETKLPKNTIDMAIMVDVYHELAYPFEIMDSIMQALKSGGRIVFVEYKAEDANVPIKALHKMSEKQIKLEASIFALEWERTVTTLPWQHVVIFRKR
jgi:precorrin-6B methylase 2